MKSFRPRDENFRERVLASFGRQGFMGHINARIAELSAGYLFVQLDQLHQGHPE